MSWLERIRPQPDPGARAPEDPAPASVERTSPGLAVLFGALKADGGHSILDLGPAGSRHLLLFERFARQIRFVGLVPTPPRGEAFTTPAQLIPPNLREPYDVVLAWDILDRIEAQQRSALIERLAEVTAPGASLYVVVRSSAAATMRPMRSTLVGPDRVAQEAVGPPEPAQGQLLPAQVERLLTPFEVLHAFSLKVGMREYVARKGSGGRTKPGGGLTAQSRR